MGVLSSLSNKRRGIGAPYDQSQRRQITNLEIKLSFTEDLIEKLNETVYKQQQQIEFLYRELKAVKEQAGSGGSGSLKDEIPPHY